MPRQIRPPMVDSSSSESEFVCPMMAALDEGSLTVSKTLDEFRKFFDLRTDVWNKSRKELRSFALDKYPLDDLKDQESARMQTAEDFLEENGEKYWGTSENRKKYLDPKALQQSPVYMCTYLKKKEPMTRGLMMLLEKIAKASRNKSISEDTPRDLANTSHIPGSTSVADTLPIEPIQLSPINMNEVSSPPAVSSLSAHAYTSPHARKYQEAHFQVQGNTLSIDMLRTQQECQRLNTKATFFLVREDGTGARDTICGPYREFHSASHFLAVMTEAYGLPKTEDSALQLQEMSGNPIRRLRYAVVRPKWAKASFQIRAGRDADWRALQNILEVAWAVSSRGDLATTYFKIEVTLKVE